MHPMHPIASYISPAAQPPPPLTFRQKSSHGNARARNHRTCGHRGCGGALAPERIFGTFPVMLLASRLAVEPGAEPWPTNAEKLGSGSVSVMPRRKPGTCLSKSASLLSSLARSMSLKARTWRSGMEWDTIRERGDGQAIARSWESAGSPWCARVGCARLGE